MDAQPSPETIAEQDKLREDLIARYGDLTFNRALEMSGIRTCLQAMAVDALSTEERQACYMRAGMHLARLQATLLTREEAVAVTECAQRLDAALDAWMFDAIEAREGLPQGAGYVPRPIP